MVTKSQNENAMPMQPDTTNVLTEAALKDLQPYARQMSSPAGTAIVRRGDQGSAFYIVVSGRLEVILRQQGRRLPLAHLEQGASFGEMSLLTQVPVSADVSTVTDAQLLMIPAERFQDALAASAPLRNHIFARLCNNVRRTSSQSWDLFQHTQALSSLMHVADSDEPIICQSPAMTRLQKRINQLTWQTSPVLITGEEGTGKFFIAKKIHRTNADPDDPLIILDCQQIGENQANKIIFGVEHVSDFTNHDSEPDSSDLQAKGALHLADKGTIILRHIDALEIPAQKNLYLYLHALTGPGDTFPKAHVIATTNTDLTILADNERFDTQLAEQLTANVLEIPPLRKRKRDILSLAELFLTTGRSQNDDSASDFTKAAEHALLSGRYQHRNVAELREAVELAATFADDDHVDAQHIFTGPKNLGHSTEFDLTTSPIIHWLIKRSSLRLLQGMMLAIFTTLIVLCFVAATTLTGRIANTIVWALWWPGLLILFLFVGRIWCTVCPISAAGRITRLLGSFKMTPPEWIKNYTGWIMAFLFFIIMWFEHVFHMPNAPFATSILLLSLMSMPILFCLLFQREMWCRYLCPLGSLAAGFSVCSTVQVHANPSVCASQCNTHECFKGSDSESGCPVYHHPLYARDAHFCKLCFKCLRTCPHQSAKIYIHPPLQNLWRLAELGTALVPFALSVFFLAIVMLSTHRLLFNATTTGFSILAGTAMILALILQTALKRLFPDHHDPAPTSRIAFALLVLAWGPFMAFHLENVPQLDTILIKAADNSLLTSIFNHVPITLLFILQLTAIIFAAACTAICFWRIAARRTDKNQKTTPAPWLFILTLCAIYLLIAITLILPQVPI